MVDSASDKGAGESSGLADIMEVAEAIGSTNDAGYGVTPPAADHDDAPDLGAGYGTIAAAAVVVAEPEPAADHASAARPERGREARSGESGRVVATSAVAAAEPKKSGGATLWIAAVGVAAIVGGGWWYVQNEDAKKQQAKAQQAAAMARVEPQEEKSEPPEPEPEVEAKQEVAVAAPPVAPVESPPADEPTGGAEPAAAEAAAEEEVAIVEETAGTKSKPASKSEGKSTKGGSGGEPTPKAESEPKAEPAKPTEPEKPVEPKPDEPKPDDSSKFSSDCVLDPTKPGCGGSKSNEDKPTTDVDASLPDKLSSSQIKDGFAPFKSKAKACGAEHGVAAGTTVRVKVSISGETGKVMSASALSPHDTEPVGKCVADALKEATFPRFSRAQQGTTYPVPM